MMGRMLSDLRAVVRRFLSHDGFLLAAGLSYSFLLCLAPLALLFLLLTRPLKPLGDRRPIG